MAEVPKEKNINVNEAIGYITDKYITLEIPFGNAVLIPAQEGWDQEANLIKIYDRAALKAHQEQQNKIAEREANSKFKEPSTNIEVDINWPHELLSAEV